MAGDVDDTDAVTVFELLDKPLPGIDGLFVPSADRHLMTTIGVRQRDELFPPGVRVWIQALGRG
ncbi:hypothetical protein P3W43_01580 [Salinicola salarius]|uniref:hypothetical protein n=1 Tax=Salinicola salarius TaxID=430457 RepID=UPI0023E42B08|nr:hypothetical protein [Salinicola salarius]MDF3917540.1 hypothetical protein [Salinicola salarius]